MNTETETTEKATATPGKIAHTLTTVLHRYHYNLTNIKIQAMRERLAERKAKLEREIWEGAER